MRLAPYLFAVVASMSSLAACGKANDVPPMTEEAQGLVKNYAVRFDDLGKRAESIMQRGNAIGVGSPDAQNASRLFSSAKAKLDEMRGLVSSAPGAIKTATKDKLELQRLYDTMRTRLDTGYTEINADFDAVESWIAIAEARSTRPAP